jgi:hypothetical protein
MCGAHWRKVPPELRRDVWRHYIKGQELGLRRPSSAWFAAAHRAIEAALRGEAPRDDGSAQVGLFSTEVADG